ncbi:MAG: transcriptional coactivator p15/PC4 family protein [candidate division NC10 bacterium]
MTMDRRRVINLGRDIGAYYSVWRGEPMIHIRQMYLCDGRDKLYPVKGGQGLTLNLEQCLDLLERLDVVTHCLEQYKDLSVPREECCPFSVHIGANVYVTVEDGPYVHVRRWFLPADREPVASSLRPSRQGVYLTEQEFAFFRARFVPYLKHNVPTIANGIRCGDKLDHQSKEGWLRCGHCNPLTSEDWSLE